MGEAARLCLRALRQLETGARAFDISERFHPDSMIPGLDAYGQEAGGQGPILVHLNPPEMPAALRILGRRRLAGRLLIGCWAWELPKAPATWRTGFDFVHEVWVPSRFVADALSPLAGGKIIRVVPHPVAPPRTVLGLRGTLALPGKALLVLAVGDMRSSMARKNLMGSIEAFEHAFGADGPAHLVIKLSGTRTHPELAASVRLRVEGRPNAQVIDRDLSEPEMDGLIAEAEILLSLHRSEGFGLPLARAMAAGKAVIATSWSGNLEFMDGESAALVPYRLVPVCDPQGIYAGREQVWAEPDMAAAISNLRRLVHDPDWRHRLGAAAARRIGRLLSVASYRDRVGERFRHAAGTGISSSVASDN